MAAVTAAAAVNQLNGVAAVSRSDAWAVGFSGNGWPATSVNKTLIERWNGSSWRIWPSPNPVGSSSMLNGVAAVSGTSAWAVGSAASGSFAIRHTLIEHWNGTKWNVQPSPNPAPGQDELTAVAALSPTNVWAVGTYDLGKYPLIEHWNGTKWTVQPSPSRGSSSGLTSVVAISARKVWAVGSFDGFDGITHTLIEHWDGSKWTVHPSPSPGNHDNVLNGIAASGPSSIWAVGITSNAGLPRRALIERWNGLRWTTQATPAAAYGEYLHAAAAVSGTLAWAAGASGGTLVERWNGGEWRFQVTPDPVYSADPVVELKGIAAASASDAWAVGYAGEDFNPDSKTLIEHWNGKSWQIKPSPNRS
jgi:hypothetical protein